MLGFNPVFEFLKSVQELESNVYFVIPCVIIEKCLSKGANTEIVMRAPLHRQSITGPYRTMNNTSLDHLDSFDFRAHGCFA